MGKSNTRLHKITFVVFLQTDTGCTITSLEVSRVSVVIKQVNNNTKMMKCVSGSS